MKELEELKQIVKDIDALLQTDVQIPDSDSKSASERKGAYISTRDLLEKNPQMVIINPKFLAASKNFLERIKADLEKMAQQKVQAELLAPVGVNPPQFDPELIQNIRVAREQLYEIVLAQAETEPEEFLKHQEDAIEKLEFAIKEFDNAYGAEASATLNAELDLYIILYQDQRLDLMQKWLEFNQYASREPNDESIQDRMENIRYLLGLHTPLMTEAQKALLQRGEKVDRSDPLLRAFNEIKEKYNLKKDSLANLDSKLSQVATELAARFAENTRFINEKLQRLETGKEKVGKLNTKFMVDYKLLLQGRNQGMNDNSFNDFLDNLLQRLPSLEKLNKEIISLHNRIEELKESAEELESNDLLAGNPNLAKYTEILRKLDNINEDSVDKKTKTDLAEIADELKSVLIQLKQDLAYAKPGDEAEEGDQSEFDEDFLAGLDRAIEQEDGVPDRKPNAVKSWKSSEVNSDEENLSEDEDSSMQKKF